MHDPCQTQAEYDRELADFAAIEAITALFEDAS